MSLSWVMVSLIIFSLLRKSTSIPPLLYIILLICSKYSHFYSFTQLKFFHMSLSWAIFLLLLLLLVYCERSHPFLHCSTLYYLFVPNILSLSGCFHMGLSWTKVLFAFFSPLLISAYGPSLLETPI